MEDRKHAEIMAKLNHIETKISEKEYLPRDPYKRMLSPMRFLYEHPKLALFLLVGALDFLFDLNKIGIVTIIYKLYHLIP